MIYARQRIQPLYHRSTSGWIPTQRGGGGLEALKTSLEITNAIVQYRPQELLPDFAGDAGQGSGKTKAGGKTHARNQNINHTSSCPRTTVSPFQAPVSSTPPPALLRCLCPPKRPSTEGGPSEQGAPQENGGHRKCCPFFLIHPLP